MQVCFEPWAAAAFEKPGLQALILCKVRGSLVLHTILMAGADTLHVLSSVGTSQSKYAVSRVASMGCVQ